MLSVAVLQKGLSTDTRAETFVPRVIGPDGITADASIDYKGNPFSSSVDLPFTMVMGGEGNMAKIVAWYDNEWGYSVRTADLAAMMAKHL